MSILFAILLFSFLIFIHEFGHFVTAKLSGVQVNEFSIFMGPAIFKKQKGETLYSLRCIPIGGFCAMEGEDGASENPRAFGNAKWWKRFLILIAGSFMNFVTGFLLLALVVLPKQTIVEPVIASADPGCTVVSETGLHVGDRILEVDGERVYVHSNFSILLSLKGDTVHDLVVERDGQKVTLKDFEMKTHIFENEDGTEGERYGIWMAETNATLGKKLVYTWNSSLDVVRTVRLSLVMLFSGQADFRDLSGPFGIVQIMYETAAQSKTQLDALKNLLYFGGFIAINLAVMNLLPIPALDGGRAVCLLLTAAFEGITRKKIDPKYEAYLHGIGMILLLLLMAVIMLKDIIFIFKG